MSVDYDNFNFDEDVNEDLDDIVVARMHYWIGNCLNDFIPDHIRWAYKKRLYLLNMRLTEIQQECQNALERSNEFPSEQDWLEDWAINRALEKLEGK